MGPLETRVKQHSQHAHEGGLCFVERSHHRRVV